MDVRPLREADRDRARAWLRAHWQETMAGHEALVLSRIEELAVAGVR